MYGKVRFTKDQLAIAKSNGIGRRTLDYRIQKGYTIEQAVTTKPYERVLKRRV